MCSPTASASGIASRKIFSNSDDVGMVEGGHGLRLTFETGTPLGITGEVLGEDLERLLALQAGILGPVT